jgi:hypothetical protein
MFISTALPDELERDEEMPSFGPCIAAERT